MDLESSIVLQLKISIKGGTGFYVKALSKKYEKNFHELDMDCLDKTDNEWSSWNEDSWASRASKTKEVEKRRRKTLGAKRNQVTSFIMEFPLVWLSKESIWIWKTSISVCFILYDKYDLDKSKYSLKIEMWTS